MMRWNCIYTGFNSKMFRHFSALDWLLLTPLVNNMLFGFLSNANKAKTVIWGWLQNFIFSLKCAPTELASQCWVMVYDKIFMYLSVTDDN